MSTKDKHIVVFDLDDTLYSEYDFVKSAFKHIATRIASESAFEPSEVYTFMLNKYSKGEEIFGNTLSFFGTNRTSAELLKWYREHNPQLRLSPAASRALSTIKRRSFKVGLVTDGRSQQQRNKLSSLGLSNYFDDVIISEEFGSEKPDSRNFRYFQDKYGSANYWYIGDNVGKDFLAPNELNWQTICLTDSGNNVHPQSFDHPSKYLPDFKIKSIEESLALIFG